MATVAPTPVPAQDRQLAVEFIQIQQSNSQDWEALHNDFDQWRAGLVSCDRNAIAEALREFSGDFDAISREASRLPRSSAVRDQADKIIEAADKEGTALRQLRDRWQPGDVSLFEALETARSEAIALQKEVEDRLGDLREPNGDAAEAPSEDYTEAFDQVSDDWATFHDDYAALRDDQANMTVGEVSANLSALLDQLSQVVAAIGDLPEEDAASSITESLQEAATAELDALQTVTDAYQNLPDDGDGSEPDQALFDAVDEGVAAGGRALDSARDDLMNQGGSVSSADLTAVNQFQTALGRLQSTWNAFHQDYDEWQRNGRGCDQAQAIATLDEFAARARELAAQAQDLPQTSFLSPMERALVEAAQREEEAFRVLRNNWRPFSVDVYRGVDRERRNAGNLRRQAQRGLRELMNRFGIAAQDL